MQPHIVKKIVFNLERALSILQTRTFALMAALVKVIWKRHHVPTQAQARQVMLCPHIALDYGENQFFKQQ